MVTWIMKNIASIILLLVVVVIVFFCSEAKSRKENKGHEAVAALFCTSSPKSINQTYEQCRSEGYQINIIDRKRKNHVLDKE